MAKYIKSTIVHEASITAGDVRTDDLPVNPLSHLLITVRGLNVTNEATIAELLARLTSIRVLKRGTAVWDISGTDLFAYNIALLGKAPFVSNQVATDDAVRDITLVLPFGRTLYNPNEAMGSNLRGELQLETTFSATETAVDNLEYIVTAVEMPEANPARHVKVTSASQTPVDGVDNDIPLAIGNPMFALFLFSTTVPTATAETASIENARLLLNNAEVNLGTTLWESLHGELLNRVGHVQPYDASADDNELANYGLVDFSPAGNDEFLLETQGASSLVFRYEGGDTETVRVMIGELVQT